ncbi:hypothetical protein ACQP00_02220 [Dactylosporangium sp. CS-047395]
MSIITEVSATCHHIVISPEIRVSIRGAIAKVRRMCLRIVCPPPIR